MPPRTIKRRLGDVLIEQNLISEEQLKEAVAIQRATIHLAGILRLESPRATQRIAEGIDQAISTSAQGQRIIRDLMEAYGRVTV